MRLLLLILLSTFTVAKAQSNADVPISLPPTSPVAAAPSATGSPANASTITPAQFQAIQNAHALRDASELIRDGKADEALAKLNALLQSDPHNLAAYVFRGKSTRERRCWTKRRTIFKAAQLIDPKNMLVKFDVAEIKFIQKDYVGARVGFAEIQVDKSSDLGDLASYKVFLCDLLAATPTPPKKNSTPSTASVPTPPTITPTRPGAWSTTISRTPEAGSPPPAAFTTRRKTESTPKA